MLNMEEKTQTQMRRMVYEILKPAGADTSARLGRLTISGRDSIDTPNFIPLTSRGIIPHLTPDVLQKHLNIGGAYFALEDCE